MGNQGHSQDEARRGQEYLMAGAIGDVKEVHVWTNRPLGYWPQGVPRPARDRPATRRTLRWNNNGVTRRLAAAMSATTRCPTDSSWDLFLGVAPDVEYHPLYHPFNWRGWVDWGQGALGDMGAHLIDHPVWGLEARTADVDRDDLDAVQRASATRTRRRRTTSSPARNGHAGGEADVVRRRPDAAEAGRARRRKSG